jgi:hypothetical protein
MTEPSIVSFVGDGRIDGVTQNIGRAFFRQVGGRSRRFHSLLRIEQLIDRQTDHDGGWTVRLDPSRGFDAVHVRHIDVHHDHVGIELVNECHGFHPIARLPHHLQMGIARHNTPQTLRHKGVIVY